MAFGYPQNLVTLPDGRIAGPTYPLANSAGYAVNVQNNVQNNPPSIPWYYRATYSPGQINSYIAPTLYSYLPPIVTIHH